LIYNPVISGTVMPCTNSSKSLQAILEMYFSSYYGATTTDYLLVAEMQLEDHQIRWVNAPPPPTKCRYMHILICHGITEITIYRYMGEVFGGEAECMEQSGLTSHVCRHCMEGKLDHVIVLIVFKYSSAWCPSNEHC